MLNNFLVAINIHLFIYLLHFYLDPSIRLFSHLDRFSFGPFLYLALFLAGCFFLSISFLIHVSAILLASFLASRFSCRVQIQKEVISDLKRENQFLSKEICESLWLIFRERSVNTGFKTGFYGAWHYGFPPRISFQTVVLLVTLSNVAVLLQVSFLPLCLFLRPNS